MPPRALTRRYKDLIVLYTPDYQDNNIPVRQRIYKSETGEIQTPITPLFEARVISADCPIKNVSAIEYRNIQSCFNNPSNSSGQSDFTTIIPYKGGDSNNAALQKEIRDLPFVIATEYRGESVSIDLLELV